MSHEAKFESFMDLLLRRHAIMVAVSSAFLGVLTDVLSPVGGLYVSLTIATFCVTLVLLIWLKRDWVIKQIESRDFLRRTLGDFLPSHARCHETPLFQYALIGAFVFGITSLVTKANADEGGMLASRFEPVSAFQSMMGIMKSVQADVGQIRIDTTEIKETLKGLDKETSDDPRKELAKRGLLWHPIAFLHVAVAGDLESVRLFQQAGMNKILDYSQTCMGLGNLMFEYAGSPDLEADIWEEVIKAVGDKTLQECGSINVWVGETNSGIFPSQTAQALRIVLDFYEASYKKANPDSWATFQGFSEVSPLISAVWLGKTDLVKAFIQHGANPNRGVNVINAGEAHKVVISPLSEAKRLGNLEITQILKENGATEIRSGIPWKAD